MKHLGRCALAVLFATAPACGDGSDGTQIEREQDAAVVVDDESELDASEPQDARVERALDASRIDSGPAASDASSREAGASDAQAARDAAQSPSRDAAQASGPSSGCGKSVGDAPGEFTAHTLRVGTADRSYQVYLPERYQATRRYPVVFRFHGSSGNGLSGGLDIQSVAPADLIVVAPDGLNTTWTTGNADIALFDALVSAVGEAYCVDLGRMFAYGFSAGAGFTELLSCVRGNTLRGVAAVEGYDWGRGKSCEGPVAAWLLHDVADTSAPIAGGRAARDRLLQQNGCTMESDPAGESCVRYRGCAEGHPVVWCETEGNGHDIRGDYAPEQAWKFFSALPM